MVREGQQAPAFECPAVVDGDVEQVDLETHLGSGILVLAFYPGDFNPACSEESTDLDGFDIFTIQQDVAVFGISGDSVHSHRAFAERYSLDIPLVSDLRGSIAEQYGVAAGEEAGYLTQRAVFVIDKTGTVEYAWRTDSITALPDPSRIRQAVDGASTDRAAVARYRVGHAHYLEGRRAFTSAMDAYEGTEWVMAETDFTRATEEFREAAEEFETSAQSAENEPSLDKFERAKHKAEALREAAECLADSAAAHAGGESATGRARRTDAKSPLEAARERREPPDPDEFTPETDSGASDVGRSFATGESSDTSLDLDLPADVPATDDGSTTAGTPEATEAGTEPEAPDTEEIDDAELEEIAAELKEQNERTEEHSERTDESDTAESDEQRDEETVELDLVDPTEREDEDESEHEDENEDDTDDDFGDSDGRHGVPDSL